MFAVRYCTCHMRRRRYIIVIILSHFAIKHMWSWLIFLHESVGSVCDSLAEREKKLIHGERLGFEHKMFWMNSSQILSQLDNLNSYMCKHSKLMGLRVYPLQENIEATFLKLKLTTLFLLNGSREQYCCTTLAPFTRTKPGYFKPNPDWKCPHVQLWSSSI